MTCYSNESRDRIFVKVYGFFSFDKYTGKSSGKNIKFKWKNWISVRNQQAEMINLT